MIKTVMKTIGTLTAGCVVGVVVALSWTGQGDLDATLSYVNELEIMIKDHAGNADALLERLEEQQAVYRNDVKVYYDAVKEGNAQTSKANAEIEKANEAAAKLKVTVEDKVNKIKEEVGGTNKVPDLIQNPDVNHPDGEHDNGAGSITPPEEGVVIHSKDVIITKAPNGNYLLKNTKPSAIPFEYIRMEDEKLHRIHIKENETIVITPKTGSSFKYTSQAGETITGVFN